MVIDASKSKMNGTNISDFQVIVVTASFTCLVTD